MKPFVSAHGAYLAASCLLSLSVWAGTPRVTYLFPAGGQRGSEVEVEFRGSNLEDATGVSFDEPGFEVESVKAEKGKFKTKIKIAAGARLGEHQLRVLTASGLADLRLFYVTPFPMVPEVEYKNEPNKAQPIGLGTTVSGQTQNEDQDHFEIELKKGQRISAEVIAARLQTQQIYDPALVITKADGTLLSQVDDTAFSRQDPVLSFVVPEDGKYILTLKEATNSGQGECQYLLNVGAFSRPLAVYPAGGQAGEELKVKLLGDAAGAVEKTIKLPLQVNSAFELFTEEGQPTPQPNLIRVSPFANVLEAEPNNAVGEATATDKSLPLAFNGIIQDKGDVDMFKFSAKKGQDYDVTVYARRLRSPLDSVVSIYDLKGNRVAQNDDAGNVDSYLRWKAPADGDFYLGVNDQLQRGGPDYTYRVEVTSPQPKAGLWLPEMVLNNNQERRAVVIPKGNRYATLVKIKRTDFAGELQLQLKDLPPGVTATGTLVDKSVDTVAMVFEAGAEVAPMAKGFHIDAQWAEVPKDATFLSETIQTVDVTENGNQKSFYTVEERQLPLAVVNEIPVKLNLEAPKVPLLQNGSMNLKVHVERTGEFKGPVTLTLLYAPPGIGSAGGIQVKEGEAEATYTISANGNAPLKKWQVCIVGTADFGKGPVWMSSQLVDVEIAEPYVSGQIVRTFVDQGDSTMVTVKLDQKKPFEGKAKLSLLGLPPNTTADEKEITKDDKEVQFTVKAAATAPAASHKQLFCQFQLSKDGETMSGGFAQGGILRVDKATLAKKEEAKP